MVSKQRQITSSQQRDLKQAAILFSDLLISRREACRVGIDVAKTNEKQQALISMHSIKELSFH